MIKYFHELTKEEFERDVIPQGITWEECAEMHPQPSWCSYPDAVQGKMGCWSLMTFMVTSRRYCRKCECYLPKQKRGQQVKERSLRDTTN